YDLLDPERADSQLAAVRLEDVNPESDPDQLRAIADYLHSQDVPFQVAVIPVMLDRTRSEEHTSELQSRFDLVCRRLLEKKKYVCRMEDWQYLIVYAYVGACFLSFVWATCHNNGNGLSNIRNFFNLENRTHSNG